MDYKADKRRNKLEKYQRMHRELNSEIKHLEAQMKPLRNKSLSMKHKLYNIGRAIYDLKHDGKTPEITDHAIVRYLERIKGWDIPELKLEIANHRQARKVDNVIVTVVGADDEEAEVDDD